MREARKLDTLREARKLDTLREAHKLSTLREAPRLSLWANNVVTREEHTQNVKKRNTSKGY